MPSCRSIAVSRSSIASSAPGERFAQEHAELLLMLGGDRALVPLWMLVQLPGHPGAQLLQAGA